MGPGNCCHMAAGHGPAHAQSPLCPLTGVLKAEGRLPCCSLQLPARPPQAPLKRGDGVAFDAGRPEEREEGGSVYDLMSLDGGATGISNDNNVPAAPGTTVELVFGPGQVRSERRLCLTDLSLP